MNEPQWELYLDELAAQGVLLWPNGDQLTVEGDEAALTDDLLQQLSSHKTALLPVLQQSKRQHPLALGQRALWLEQQVDESGFAYNISLALRLLVPVEPTRIEAMFQQLVNRHAALRTSFPLVDEKPVQQIYRYRPVKVAEVQAVDWSAAALQQAIKAAHEQPFDVTQSPLFRLTLYHYRPEEQVLLFTMHHLICDGWSVWQMLAELRQLHQALQSDTPVALPALQSDYTAYVDWQAHLLAEKEEELWGYWQQQLAGELPILNLPTDRPRPAIRSGQGAAHPLALAPALTEQLTQLAQREGVTLYMVLLAAFQLLLHRYSGQDDILVGSPFAGRSQAEFAGVVGYFTSPLVMRANLAGNPSFRDFLQQVRTTVLAAFAHQDYPFARLVERLQPERQNGLSVIYQAMFALQRAQGDSTIVDLVTPATTATMTPIDFGGLPVLPYPVAQYEGQFDLFLEFFQRTETLVGAIKYNPDLFDPATIARMADHWQTLLASIIAQPACAIAELPLLPGWERQQLLLDWNQTAAPYPQGKCLHQWVEEQAARTPDAIALRFAQQQLTYRALNERANRLAHHLQSLGVGVETLVGVCLERSVEMIVGLLGILKAGGAYVPLDPAYPQERLGFILADTQVPVLLTQQKVITHLPRHDAQVVDLVADWPQIARQPSHNPPCQTTPANLAYILYTSGSTGRPKGVAIEHHSPVALIAWSEQVFSNAELAGVLASTSICFDLSIFEIFLTLCRGGTVLLVENALELLDTPLAGQVTLINTVPSAMTELVRSNAIPASVQVVNLAGEPLKNALVQRIYQTPTVCKVYNLYGPSEDTTYSTFVLAPKGATTEPTIGRPIANTQAYIVDPHRQPAPIGVAGELLLGGAGLARGYLHRPELTNEKFIANPFGPGRLYRTGDLVRYTATGEIQFLGRLDHQIKIRGFRVELGEIESALRQHPAVREAMVLAREERPGDKHLVGYLVADQVDSALQSDHLQQWQELYEETYRQPSDAIALALNLAGWRSSYTGEPIPADEMAEWIAATLADIRQLHPKQILEIGCGTGLLLAQLAPDCDSYWGTDYSAQALAHVAQLKAAHHLDQVQLAQRMADDFSGLADGQFDCVILNSVAQYFPSIDYLLTVLTGAVRVVRPGGAIFVGDVRNFRLLQAYHAAVQSYQAAAELPLSQLQDRVQRRLQEEEELLIDPDFFYALPSHLPQIGAVAVRLKRGHAHNELTQFRYQVVLHIGPSAADAPQEWREENWLLHQTTPAAFVATLQQRHADHPTQGIIVRNLPNARLQAAVQTVALLTQAEDDPSTPATVGQLRTHLATQPPGVEPAAVWAWADTLPYTVELTEARTPGLMDAYLLPKSSTATALTLPDHRLPTGHRPWASYANNPLLGKLSRTLLPTLRPWLGERLPDYMVPAAFVLLDALPLTPNGKIDRKALPAPQRLHQPEGRNFVPPQTATEQTLVNIWGEVLGIQQISIHDNFFDLGGHSLLATQVVSRINTTWAMQLPLKNLFERPTVQGLAERLEVLQMSTQRPAPTTGAMTEEGEL